MSSFRGADLSDCMDTCYYQFGLCCQHIILRLKLIGIIIAAVCNNGMPTYERFLYYSIAMKVFQFLVGNNEL